MQGTGDGFEFNATAMFDNSTAGEEDECEYKLCFSGMRIIKWCSTFSRVIIVGLFQSVGILGASDGTGQPTVDARACSKGAVLLFRRQKVLLIFIAHSLSGLVTRHYKLG